MEFEHITDVVVVGSGAGGLMAAVTTNTSGTVVATIGYYPFGGTRYTSGILGTDKKFTGRRLDQDGLCLLPWRSPVPRIEKAEATRPFGFEPAEGVESGRRVR